MNKKEQLIYMTAINDAREVLIELGEKHRLIGEPLICIAVVKGSQKLNDLIEKNCGDL